MNFGRDQSKFSLKSVQALREVRDPVWTVASSSYSWLVKKGKLYPNLFPCLRREITTKKKKKNIYLPLSSEALKFVRPRWKSEAGLKSPDVRLPSSLHLWPTSGHRRASPAGTSNCAHTTESSLIAHCPLPAFLKKKTTTTTKKLISSFLLALCSSSKSKIIIIIIMKVFFFPLSRDLP